MSCKKNILKNKCLYILYKNMLFYFYTEIQSQLFDILAIYIH